MRDQIVVMLLNQNPAGVGLNYTMRLGPAAVGSFPPPPLQVNIDAGRNSKQVSG